MGSRKIKGVLDNFLGTYTSRYSDFAGYWLFGLLQSNLSELEVDLLNSKEVEIASTPVTAAEQIAKQKFIEQMDKSGLHLSCLQEAKIKITKLPDSRTGPVNGRPSSGSTVRLVVRVKSISGREYEREASIFVAPHNPNVELRSVGRK